MELDLVQNLRAIAADEVEESGRTLGRVLPRAREVESSRQPVGIVRQMLQQHRPAFGDGVVAEPLLFHRKLARGVREVLRVSGLVEERAPVVGPADRLNDEDHLVRNLDRRAERTRRLVRTLFEIERHVFLRSQVDTEIGEGRLQRRKHSVLGEELVPLGRAEETRHVPARCLAESDADARAEQLIRCRFPQTLR